MTVHDLRARAPATHAGHRRVVVIDDDPGIRRYARRALSTAGYLVDEASGGYDGLALIVDDPPDLVLLDLGLADMPGEAVLARIRALRPALPVVVWTAGVDAHAEGRCRSLAPAAFLHKPLSLATLVSSVRRGTEKHRPSPH